MGTKLEILRERVKEDLKHIPRGSRTQNYFRQMYSQKRMEDVSKSSKTKEETFKEIWDSCRKIEAEFIPEYDKTYFQTNPKELQHDK
jgi:hypothetical protein